MGDDFKLTFKIDNKTHLKLAKKSIVYIVLSLLSLLYFILTKDDLGSFMALFILTPLIPQLIIHIQYYLTDRNKEINVNHSKWILTIEKRRLQWQISFDEIDKIINHQGQRDKNNYLYALPFSFYNYTDIKLMN